MSYFRTPAGVTLVLTVVHVKQDTPVKNFDVNVLKDFPEQIVKVTLEKLIWIIYLIINV